MSEEIKLAMKYIDCYNSEGSENNFSKGVIDVLLHGLSLCVG